MSSLPLSLAISILFGLGFAAICLTPMFREIRLLRWGVPTRGRIIEVLKSARKGEEITLLIYRFSDARGIDVEGTCELPAISSMGYIRRISRRRPDGEAHTCCSILLISVMD